MTVPLPFFAAAPKGFEDLLADELRSLGLDDVRPARSGVTFQSGIQGAYRACLWSRLANRILMPIAQFPAGTPEELYGGVLTINWNQHLAADGTLAVDFHSGRSRIQHTHFGALKVKDAIVDQFRERTGGRPSVATEAPDVRINVYVLDDQATLSIDLSGESLHRRGYRVATVAAPLKENLAAAILLRSRWPELARDGARFVDLMCGSGTLPIEAAMIAADIAPALNRDYFGFINWRGHAANVWRELVDEARARRDTGVSKLSSITGYDSDPSAIRAARANVVRAGLEQRVVIERRDIADCHVEPETDAGLVIANPPYGERLGDESELPGLYRALGDAMKRCYTGWRGAVFTGNPDLGKVMGLRAHRMHTLWNGAIECRLLHFDITDSQFVRERSPAEQLLRHSSAPLSAGAEMFANRLRKNLKTLGKWARNENLCCYRLYDADMPEYAVAIDLYQGDDRWAHVQEYAAPKSVDPARSRERLKDILHAIPMTLDLPASNVFLKVRERQKGKSQYERLADRGEFHEVSEDGLRLLVNFSDYLDTGLFLDHRLTRRLIRELSPGRRFLNLFGYTGAASVHAAAGGATTTTTVDMSRTYLDWARRNMSLNGFGGRPHEFIQTDVFTWLRETGDRQFDLVFLDPPTFSTSKRMQGTLDIQRDHVHLIRTALDRTARGGELLFSCNFRRFDLDRETLADLDITDITRDSIPRDFARNPRIHQCFRIRRRS